MPLEVEFKEAEMRKLFFTTGSPFARAVRIVLVEKGLDFEREETVTTPSVEERAKITPTLQVPALIDGELTIWDSAVIIDYLMTNYPSVVAPEGMHSLAVDYVRVAENWHDKLVLVTLLTLASPRQRCRSCNGPGSDMKKMAMRRDALFATSISSTGSRLSSSAPQTVLSMV